MRMSVAAIMGAFALSLALIVWAFGAGAQAQGAAPSIADQIPPEHPQFLHLGREINGRDVFIEATTIGRLGDNGFVWELETAPGFDTRWTRLVVNCATRGMLFDWEVTLNPDLSVREQGPPGFSRSPLTEIDNAVVEHACSGAALPRERLYHGLQSAVSATRRR